MRVVAAVIQDRDEILCCRRAPHKALAGQWEFPGGKVESGESDKVALERELQEELGIDVQIGDFIIESSNDFGITMATYFVTLSSPRPTESSDHDELIWLSVGELAPLNWAELDVPVVREVERLRGITG